MRLVVLLTCLCSAFVSNPLHAQMLRPATTEFSILTWNVFLRPRSVFWSDHQKTRSEWITEVLLTSRQDVVVLQEAFDKGILRRMNQNGLDSLYPHQIKPCKGRFFGMTNGIWILSRHPIIDTDTIYFEDAARADRIAHKGAVLAKIRLNGRYFELIGTHAQAQESEKCNRIRRSQYQQIRDELIMKHAKTGTPQIILGDMNTAWSDTSEYAAMLHILDATDGPVIASPKADKRNGNGITWGCSQNSLIPRKKRGNTSLLDHILLRDNNSGWKSVERKTIVYRRQGNGKMLDLSDHYPVQLTINP